MHTLSQLRSGELNGVKRLTLSENLFCFPLEILTLANSLEILDLSNNNLSELPDELTQLTKLKIIFASQNNFDHLPEVLGKLPNLEMIGFKSNKIKTVAEESLPKKLRWLILTDNQIELLPNSLGERPRLQKLALAGNQLTDLPQTLANAHNLELVRISANKLTECPEQLLNLPKLAWFAFAGNPFSAIKETHNTKSVPSLSSASYTLENVLGQGASGVISKAHWNTPQTQFPDEIAVKVFKGEVTSDGYPQDELQACLQVGIHPNLVQSLALVKEANTLALIMNLIPSHYKNLGLPPCFNSCTRDTFPENFSLSITLIDKIVKQMEHVFTHLHQNQVCHGDLYAHNTLYDTETGDMIFGDFGAATSYQMLTPAQQQKVQAIEHRALNHFIDDLLSVCVEEDKENELFITLRQRIAS
ncbi:leucine-rich repeat-containing protein kinase family protein [Colwellia sp. E2M01]|uniref:leucine-rich repeat-containing protein kinase family protein n=1 Tax=Colwellia sp. E2M01 TaxID=2841561 RepID=UPI001C0955D7|nr:leucine-rich repeat-containing protein kinase family protein [Colwellia sp. E2M01]MBU2869572.1 leucine-rich repeat-containing serine/threonine-protein kinase [Colwellia sp. E2M01]